MVMLSASSELAPFTATMLGTVLGLVVGSFVGTLVLRWPAGRSVAHGRSHCDGCGRVLRAWELVPLASFLAAGGRCPRCGARIDAIHPLIELGGAAVGGLAFGLHGVEAGGAGALFGWLLLALAALDLRHFWLPDRLTLPLAALGLVGGVLGLDPVLGDRLIGAIGGWGSLALIAALYARSRGRTGLGAGDAKLFGAIGLWLGWRALPAVLLLACLGGFAALAIVRLRGTKLARETRVPFGALLAPAAWIVWLAGTTGV